MSKLTLFKGKSARTKLFTVISAVLILAVLALNLGLTALGSDKLLFLDTTREGFYTLSDKMLEECGKILNALDENGNKRQIKVTFCTDPDYLVNSKDTRMPYFMVKALANEFDNITVETVNVALNPTAVSMYKTTSRQQIEPTDIIISYGSKYRVMSAPSYWTDNYFSYNGEYRFVSALASVTAINRPVAYFLIGHGETYYDPQNPDSEMSRECAALVDLLYDSGLEIDTLDLSKVDKVPDDCALLIINNPKTDLVYDETRYNEFSYVSEAEKIDRYLLSESGACIVNRDYRSTELKNFDHFLFEWGLEFGKGQLSDEDSYVPVIDTPGDYTNIFATYDADENGIGVAYYGDYINAGSAPQMVFSNAGYIDCSFIADEAMLESGTYNAEKVYSSFITTSDAGTSNLATGLEREGKMDLAALVTRTLLDVKTAERSFSYLFCTADGDFFSNEQLGNPSYANYDVMQSVITNISRTDRYASMELGGLSYNSPNFGGKQTIEETLNEQDTSYYNGDGSEAGFVKGLSQGEKTAYVTIIYVVPVCIAVIGVVMFIKRKYL